MKDGFPNVGFDTTSRAFMLYVSNLSLYTSWLGDGIRRPFGKTFLEKYAISASFLSFASMAKLISSWLYLTQIPQGGVAIQMLRFGNLRWLCLVTLQFSCTKQPLNMLQHESNAFAQSKLVQPFQTTLQQQNNQI